MKKNIIIKVLKGIKKYFLILILLGFLISYSTIKIAVFMQYAIDGVIFKNRESLPDYLDVLMSGTMNKDLITIGLLIFIIVAICSILKYIRDILSEKFSLKINQNLKTELFNHIFNLEYNDFNSYEKAEIIQRINEDAVRFLVFLKISLV